jgi:uncharacterized protein (UPF0335 family)
MEVSAAISGDQLRNIVERIEHVEHEIQELADAKKEIYLEAKGNGFDMKILREVIRLRKQDPDERTSTNPWSKYIFRRSKGAPQQQERRCPTETAEQGTAQGPPRRRSGGHHWAWDSGAGCPHESSMRVFGREISPVFRVVLFGTPLRRNDVIRRVIVPPSLRHLGTPCCKLGSPRSPRFLGGPLCSAISLKQNSPASCADRVERRELAPMAQLALSIAPDQTALRSDAAGA